jgi:glycosyltransferase involved in cell wall biosynthesis
MTVRRVLLVADVSAETLRGGAERMLGQHARALHAAGIPFTILSRQPEPDVPLKVTIMEGVEEHRLPYDGDRGWRGLAQLRHGARQWWRQHGAGFDLVIAEQPFVMWALVQAGCRLPCLQVCYAFAYEEYATRHGLDWGWRHALAAAAMRRLEGGLYRRASHLFVLSDYSRRRLAEAFGISNGITVAGGGTDAVDDASFQARDSLRTELGWQGPVAVTLRNLVPRTGVDLLVQVAAMLRYDWPDLRWVVMGTGPLLQPLRNLAKELGVDDRVAFTEFLPESEVKRRLIAADLFVLPTRALEGFGLVTVEANACGLPVVATPVGANAEVIRSLPAPNHLAADVTPEALAQAVDTMLRQHEGADIEAMRRELREAVSRYNWAHHDARFLQCLQEIRCASCT